MLRVDKMLCLSSSISRTSFLLDLGVDIILCLSLSISWIQSLDVVCETQLLFFVFCGEVMHTRSAWEGLAGDMLWYLLSCFDECCFVSSK
jgi:hypothetical protein